MFNIRKLARVNRAMGSATSHSFQFHFGRELLLWGLLAICGGLSQICTLVNMTFITNILCSFMLFVFLLILIISSKNCDCTRSTLLMRYEFRSKALACFLLTVASPGIVAIVITIFVSVFPSNTYELLGVIWIILGAWYLLLAVSGCAQRFIFNNSYTLEELLNMKNTNVEEANYIINSLLEMGEIDLATRLSKELLILTDSKE